MISGTAVYKDGKEEAREWPTWTAYGHWIDTHADVLDHVKAQDMHPTQIKQGRPGK